jgi:NADH-quinone oxidoreductase subunit N
LFKVSAAPFHFWTADVYQGAPSLFTAYMSTVVKTAGFAALYKLLSVSFADLHAQWGLILAVVAALTLVVGNLTAMNQTSAKRTMAFSGISHAGYLLIAVAAFQAGSKEAILLYSAAYSVATIMFFAVLMQVQQAHDGEEDFSAFNGLAKTNPLLALGGAVSMLSLAGIPLTGGFMGKLYIFITGFEAGYNWLMIVAILMSAASIYYYLKLIMAMYFRTATHDLKIETSPAVRMVILVGILITVILGLFPGVITGLAS